MEQKWLVNLFIFFSFRDTNRLLYIHYDLLKSVVDLYIINVEIVLNINSYQPQSLLSKDG